MRSLKLVLIAALVLILSACALPVSPTPVPATLPSATALRVQPVPEATATAAPLPSPTQASRLPVVKAPQIAVLDMLDVNNGWAMTYDSVLRTTDGGVTWLDVTPPGVTAMSLQPASAFFLDINTAWVLVPSALVGALNPLYRTTDGGVTWAASACEFGMGMMQFVDRSHGVILVSLGVAAGSEAVRVYTTGDAGATWTPVFSDDPTAAGANDSLPFSGDKSGIAFLDPSHGWVSGSNPMTDYVYFFGSQDGGRHWAPVDLGLPAGISGVMASAEAPVFFSGKQAVLPVRLIADTQKIVFYISKDGGATWSPTTPTAGGYYSIASPADFFVWDGGASLYVSHDSGATWSTVTPNVDLSSTLSSFQFVDASTGWAITPNSGTFSLYKTVDGGKTWTVLIH